MKNVFGKVIFTNDMLRVYDGNSNLFDVPFKENVKWLANLLGDGICKALGVSEYEYFFGDAGVKSIRWKIYNGLGLPFSMDSWSEIYEDLPNNKIIDDDLLSVFGGNLVVSYESSPALLKKYNELMISYVDISIHPIRFLDDYVFAVRTNVPEVKNILSLHKLTLEYCRKKVKIYKAKSAKIPTFSRVPAGSVFFAAQMQQDSSLIEGRRMIDANDVKDALEKISIKYPKVYYKHHPHNKNTKLMDEFLSKNKKIEVVNWNIYDTLGADVWGKIISMSSGVLHEAKIFGCDTERLSKARDYYSDDVLDDLTYIPIMRFPMLDEFWHSAFNGAIFSDTGLPDPFAFGMQKSLNVSWGGRL